MAEESRRKLMNDVEVNVGGLPSPRSALFRRLE